MKIPFSVETTVDGEVEITREEITACLAGDLDDRKYELEMESEHENRVEYKRRVVINFISSVYRCFEAITPEMIEMITDFDKQAVFDSMHKSIDRFKPKPIESIKK